MVYFVLTVISAVIFTVYLVVVAGIPRTEPLPSLSDTYYLLEGRSKGLGMVFYGMLALVVFTCIAPMCQAAGGLGALAGFALLLVGAAPRFKDKKTTERTLHFAGAITAAVAALLILAKAGQLRVIPYVLILFLALSLASRTLKDSWVLWAELAAFYALFTGLYMHFYSW